MSNSESLVRQWTLLRILSARQTGVTYEELARESSVNKRTIQRDLALLVHIGFPIEHVSGEHGRKLWRVIDQTGLAQLRFTLEEAAALSLGRQFLEPLAGTLFHSGAQSAHQKIRSVLGEAALRHLEKLASGFYQTRQGWTDYGIKSNLIDDLSLAIEEHRMTVITYQSLRSTEPVTLYDVLPYALIFHKSALYLIAFSKDHDDIRTFKVDRIREVDVTRLQFTAPTDFSPEQFLEHSFGIMEGQGDALEIQVRFRPAVSRILAEKQFHASQKLTPQRDGSTIAAYRLSSLEEFSSWILSFGPEAEVLSPASVRDSVAGKLQRALEQYATQSTESEPSVDPASRQPETGINHRPKRSEPPSRSANKPKPGQGRFRRQAR
jgi:predicted DNA-binding transcriptional regulator YafY